MLKDFGIVFVFILVLVSCEPTNNSGNKNKTKKKEIATNYIAIHYGDTGKPINVWKVSNWDTRSSGDRYLWIRTIQDPWERIYIFGGNVVFLPVKNSEHMKEVLKKYVEDRYDNKDE